MSLLQARASGKGMFRSAIDRITTLSGHRPRAVPLTQPTPMPCDTKLRMVDSFRPAYREARRVTEEEARIDANGNAISPEEVPMINLSNLKHAIVPLYHAHVGGDSSKRFLHVTLAAGNDTPGRTAAVRQRASQILGEQIDKFVGDLPGLVSVTSLVQDINRDRGYSTTADRKNKRDGKS